MAHKDPFTLDLFSNTSLASGLGLGVTAFPTTFKADDSDHAPLSAILHITDGRHAAIDLRLVDPAKRMRRATSSTPSSPMLSASGPRPAITPIGARTGSPSKNPAPGSSSSPILAQFRSRPPGASRPIAGSGMNWFASACRRPRSPICRTTRSPRRSSAYSTISTPARCASSSARPTRWAPASTSSFA
jgi:hypothetical protein